MNFYRDIFNKLKQATFCFVWFALFSLSAAAFAQSSTESALIEFLQTQTKGLPGKASFSIGQMDARVKQHPCPLFDVFLPPGAKLWGKTTLGLRCQSMPFTAYVQVQIALLGSYLVASSNLSAGQVLQAQDIFVREGDLTRLPNTVLTDISQALGKSLKNRLNKDQPLRSDQLVIEWLIRQGQNVLTVARGPGFSVNGGGRALSNAKLGDTLQVRTQSGQIVRGIVQADGVVDVTH